jgi:hypothetical protein
MSKGRILFFDVLLFADCLVVLKGRPLFVEVAKKKRIRGLDEHEVSTAISKKQKICQPSKQLEQRNPVLDNLPVETIPDALAM